LNQQNCWLNQSEIVFTHKNRDFINKNWIELIEPTNSGFREQKCDWNQQKMIHTFIFQSFRPEFVSVIWNNK
jgi:hypothetical protein